MIKKLSLPSTFNPATSGWVNTLHSWRWVHVNFFDLRGLVPHGVKKVLGLLLAVYLLPTLALAQESGQFDNVEGLIESGSRIVGMLIPIVFALGLLFFFWGLAKFILSAGNPEAASSGKHLMIWGVLALFVMASIWGIVNFLGESFGISFDETFTPPTVDIP